VAVDDFGRIDSRFRADGRVLRPANRSQTAKTEEKTLAVTDSFSFLSDLDGSSLPSANSVELAKTDNAPTQRTPSPIAESAPSNIKADSPSERKPASSDDSLGLIADFQLGRGASQHRMESGQSLTAGQNVVSLEGMNGGLLAMDSNPTPTLNVIADSRAPKPSTKAQGPAKESFLSRVGHAVASLIGATTEGTFAKELKAINNLEAQTKTLKTPSDFQAKTAEFRQRLASGESLKDIRPEAYAVARRAAEVATGMRAFDCQVSGALAMDGGNIAEMKTGEGKTLTAIMPLYLNALAGKGAHLVTVNDTLASRDAGITKPAFDVLGLSVGTVLEGMSPQERRAGYNADVTYTTDRTLGFDYLRDQTARRPEDRVQREPFFALVDEVDEVLLDEARTPLIVSGKSQQSTGEYETFNTLMGKLKPGDDYQALPENNSVWLTELGLNWVESQLQIQDIDQKLKGCETLPQKAALLKDKLTCQQYANSIRHEQACERLLKNDSLTPEQTANLEAGVQKSKAEREKLGSQKPPFNLYDDDNVHRTRYLEASLKAHVLFHKGTDYIVDEGGVQIVDKNKGRTSDGRRFSNGLHQALEAKEGVKIQEEQKTTATITYPNLFKRYERLSGMTGTAWTSQAELYDSYDLAVVPISTNRPLARTDEVDEVFKTQEEKYAAVARDAAADFFSGKPVLIGTLSVEHNRYVAQELRKLGVPDEALQVLNAESVRGDKAVENEMLEDAGRSGVITVATNMAGRGANIKPDLINFKKISMDVSLAVEKGQPVVVELPQAKDAQWLSDWLGDYQPSIVGKDSKALPEPRQVLIRVGSTGISPTGGLLLNGASEEYETGGLTVYGTERAESRRVDDQLIGRAGRQGAKGRSKFYLSLEDDLFKKHGGSAVDGLAPMFKEPGRGLSGKVLQNLIMNAQTNAEMTHIELRKMTNQHDESLNIHREKYFGLRDGIVDGSLDPKEQFLHRSGNGLVESVFQRLPDKTKWKPADVHAAVAEVERKLQQKLDIPLLKANPTVSVKAKIRAEELRSQLFEIGASFAHKALSGEVSEAALRSDLLDIVDDSWANHLDSMESLKSSAQLQTWVQQDPEIFFKLESVGALEDTLSNLNKSALHWALERQ
jgi:preprotein translocase subunit SecA